MSSSMNSSNIRRANNGGIGTPAGASSLSDVAASSTASMNTVCLGKSLFGLLIGFFIGSFLTVAKTDVDLEAAASASESSGGASKNFHSGSTFGGINNIAHYSGARAYASGEGIAFEIPAADQDPAEIPSLDEPNLINHYGHYLHDEWKSPYASHLYDLDAAELEKTQASFLKKMKQVRTDWGAWTDVEDDSIQRPVVDYSSVKHRDMPNAEFPPNAWQMDESYVKKFRTEAKALVQRVTQGIYAEYGYPVKGKSEREIEQIKEHFQIEVLSKFNAETQRPERDDPKAPQGVAWLTSSAMAGLVRKLLHGMMTNDNFYVVLAGHSAAAAHGNDFLQDKVLSMHTILEPVFSKLGMRLISRNMAMGGVGTLQFSLAGKSLYGEADVLIWDSGMTEGGDTVDFFNKQALLSGARLPILLTSMPFEIHRESNNTAWVGEVKASNVGFMPVTVDEVQVDKVPFAARYMNVAEARLKNGEKYNSICWEPRTDFTPDVKQAEHPGSQVGWHPGWRAHQWEGRIYALILLEGLERALDMWEREPDFPLPEQLWHVEDAYTSIRSNFEEYLARHVGESPCEQLFKNHPEICRVPMRGHGLWTPRNMNPAGSLLTVIREAPNGYKPYYEKSNQYSGFDLLPRNQKTPDGDVDVHAIAIATNNPEPTIVDEPTDNIEETGTRRRRMKQDTQRQTPPQMNPPRRQATSAAEAQTKTPEEEGGVTRGHRQLNETEAASGNGEAIVAGRGWTMLGNNVGYCDGTTVSTCNRIPGQQCLLAGHNDGHASVAGNPMSGWLVFDVENIQHGVILARMEWFCDEIPWLTKDWTEVNGGKTSDTTPYNVTATRQLQEQHQLEPRVRHEDVYPEEHDDDDGRDLRVKFSMDDKVANDFYMDIAINGKITRTMDKKEWLGYTVEHSKNCAVWPLMTDPTVHGNVEVAIRFRSEEKPQQGFCLSHIYYA